MAIVLSDNQYGKAETRLVRVGRDGDRHELTDLNVTVALAGDLAEAHLTGDNSHVLPTDSQKNTVYAFARRYGVDRIEEFGLRLARHFVDSQPAVHRARVSIERYGWQRLGPHSFQRSGAETRTATVTCVSSGRVSGAEEGISGRVSGAEEGISGRVSGAEEGISGRVSGAGEGNSQVWVVCGLADLVLLNSTDSEFRGFVKDPYTTLPETGDRILATAVDARWRHAEAEGDWDASYAAVRDLLVQAFTDTYSRSLQQTLYAMGRRVLEHRPEVAEVRLSLPNRHHLLVDFAPFGLENPNEVFVATDRPYGVIEGTVTRDDAPSPGAAW